MKIAIRKISSSSANQFEIKTIPNVHQVMSNHLSPKTWPLLSGSFTAVADLGIVAICSEERDAGVDDDGDELDHL